MLCFNGGCALKKWCSKLPFNILWAVTMINICGIVHLYTETTRSALNACNDGNITVKCCLYSLERVKHHVKIQKIVQKS